jgi:putative selenium metabolism protein SsnA
LLLAVRRVEVSILIENATVVFDPVAGKVADGAAVVVEGAKIADVGSADDLARRYANAERLDGSGALLLPGLIDAHTHLYGALSHGMPTTGDPPHDFPQILERVWWRFDKSLRDDDVTVSAVVGSIASLRNGITTILDHHASPLAVPNSLSRLAEGVGQVGLRACLAYEVSDRDGSESRERGIAENRRFIQETQAADDPLLKGLFGLHAVFSLSDETLRRCAEESADLNVGCHMHMAEHKPEVVKFAQNHDQSIAEFLAEVGILGSKTVVAHTVHVDRDDILVLKESGTFNVHNPKSNMGNAVGISPVAEMMILGQPVGLGSDGFYDIPQEIIAAALLQTLGSGDPSSFSNQMALQMAYDHNVRFAEQVFGCQLGKISSGYAADLILVPYDPSTPLGKRNLTSHIISALSGGRVKTALVNGKLLLKDGDILGVDEERVMTKAREQAEQIWARL